MKAVLRIPALVVVSIAVLSPASGWAQDLCTKSIEAIQLSPTQFQLRCTSVKGWSINAGTSISGTVQVLPAGWRDDPAKLMNPALPGAAPLTVSFNAQDCNFASQGNDRKLFLYACSAAPINLDDQEGLLRITANGQTISATVTATAKSIHAQLALLPRYADSVAVLQAPPTLPIQAADAPGASPITVEVDEVRDDGKITPHKAYIARDPNTPGRYTVELVAGDRIRSGKATIRVKLKAPDGITLINPSPEFTVDGTPAKTPDNAEYYFKLHHVAAKDTRPSYGLVAKVAPKSFYFKNPSWRFTPSASADIAVRDSSSADTIDFAGDFLKARTRPTGHTLLADQLGLGAEFETDREFDRGNLLGHMVYTPQFRFTEMGKEKRGKISNASDHPLPGCNDKVCHLGYGFGLEPTFQLGGATIIQTSQNSAKTQSISVPRYVVARIFPKLTGFIEYDRLTLRAEAEPRYLLTTEQMPQELPSGDLVNRKVSGFRPYQEGTIEFAFDRDKHVSLSVSYKDGSAPPTYQNLNKVETGLVFLF